MNKLPTETAIPKARFWVYSLFTVQAVWDNISFTIRA